MKSFEWQGVSNLSFKQLRCSSTRYHQSRQNSSVFSSLKYVHGILGSRHLILPVKSTTAGLAPAALQYSLKARSEATAVTFDPIPSFYSYRRLLAQSVLHRRQSSISKISCRIFPAMAGVNETSSFSALLHFP